ncbi:MAG: glycosyltransferase [Chloroflexi bacterium]|nr:glycosyltransferase [Chloroflexota bacterium]
MSDRPLVSIVVPSYNQAAYLGAALDSIFAQAYKHIQVIVMDAGSTDDSAVIIKRHAARLDYWQSQADAGQTDAINQGFAKAKGKYLAWLNSDDVLLPNAVKEAVNFLEAHPEVGMVYGDADFINQNGEVVGRFKARQTDYRRLLRGFVHVPQPTALWRASLWEQVGPLDESIYFAMDYDLWVRLAKVSELRYHARNWAQFRLHADSKTMQGHTRAWPDMFTVQAREGGRWLSWLRLRYWVRSLLSPLLALRWRKIMK